MKVSIIGGAGLVGSCTAFALQMGGIAREIALLDVAAEALRCPWHCQKITLRHLRRSAMPMIVRRDSAVVVLPGAGDVPVRAQQRVLLAVPPTQ